jgi:23S rRNA (adenine2030-N6)-methyltransferase
MLSYRHGYHAGNFADVFKHIVLTVLLQALARKDRPFIYIDTHAGAGRYDLRSESAHKNREFDSGIGRIWSESNPPAAVAAYLNAVAACNRGATANTQRGEAALPRWYPGSPRIAAHFLRADDRMILAELHSSEQPLLQREFQNDQRVTIVRGDGYHLLKSQLPPSERRGLVLIDPSYEPREEIKYVIDALRDGHTRWASGSYAIWYPILPKIAVARLHRRVIDIGFEKILCVELCVLPDDSPLGMNGNGMLLINPPYLVDEQLNEFMPWLHAHLDVGGGRHSIRWLTAL